MGLTIHLENEGESCFFIVDLFWFIQIFVCLFTFKANASEVLIRIKIKN